MLALEQSAERWPLATGGGHLTTAPPPTTGLIKVHGMRLCHLLISCITQSDFAALRQFRNQFIFVTVKLAVAANMMAAFVKFTLQSNVDAFHLAILYLQLFDPYVFVCIRDK